MICDIFYGVLTYFILFENMHNSWRVRQSDNEWQLKI